RNGVEQMVALAKASVLAGERAVVRGDYDGRVAGKAKPIELTQEVTQPAIDERDLAGVQGDGAPALGFGQQRGVLRGLDHVPAVVRRVVALAVGRRRVPRLVGIEAVDPEEEPVVGVVALEPPRGGRKE